MDNPEIERLMFRQLPTASGSLAIEVESDPTGPYVRYSDHLAAIAAERERVREVREDLERYAGTAREMAGGRFRVGDLLGTDRCHGKAQAYDHAAELLATLFPDIEEEG